MEKSFVDTVNKIIPVVISLAYSNRFLKFQVNPESIKKVIPSSSTKTQIEGIGEISSPSTPGLSTINISSFFWQERNLVPTDLYIDWLSQWQKSKKPAKLVVTKLNYSMYVTCESFEYETRAGEESDIYYTLQLQEYRKYGAKKLKLSGNNLINEKSKFNFFDWSIGDARKSFTPVLIDIPRPERLSTMKVIINPYKTKKGDTVLSITKKLRDTTSGWKDLYELNKELLGDIIGEGDGEIPINTKLTLPESWLGVKDLNINYKPWEI